MTFLKSPSDTNITTSNNTAGGHIASGDVNAPVNIGCINYTPSVEPETALARLYRKLKNEAGTDEYLTGYIAQLEIFTRVVDSDKVIGIEGKLAPAGRGDQVDMAEAMKEMIYGELRANMFSRTFQTIYATLMGKIFEEFDTHVRPLIVNGATRSQIDVAINLMVVKPIVSELEQCPEYDQAATQTVRGMIYFLTGNCHLKWHKC